MAEDIGGVSVSITGDYSQLQADFASAQTAAQTAGENIAGAFTTAAQGTKAFDDAAAVATEQMNLFGSALDAIPFQEVNGQFNLFATELETIQGSAAGAAGAVGTFSDGSASAAAAVAAFSQETTTAADSTEAVAKSAGDASGRFSEMADKLLAIGEALAVTEGLREFGIEALHAADNVTHADIALTTLTGDGDKAKSTIEGLDQLGMADGLAFPSLLTAGTRMQALLGPAVDVTKELGLVADGAAVMGTDIVAATQRFDQLIISGNASARTLTQFGLSLQSLADGFNRVIPGSDATAASVAKMFKALDETDKITVANNALEKLGGTAQKVAEQTFGGQWQQLANAWDQVMIQVGQALLPVISELTDFLKLDVMPFLHDLAEGFNALPAPVRNAAVGIGLAAAAIIPLTAGLAAAGLAVSGLSGLLPALEGLLATLGITAGETAVAEGAMATATEGLEAAATVTGGVITGLAGFIGVGLVAGIAAAIISLADLRGRLDSAHASIDAITKLQFDEWLASATTHLKNASISVDDLDKAMANLKKAVDLEVISETQYIQSAKAVQDAIVRVKNEDIASTLAQWDHGFTLLSGSTAKATDATTLLAQSVADAKTKLEQVSAAYQAGTATAAQLTSAQSALTTAQNNYQAALGPVPGSLAAIDAAAQKLAGSTSSLGAQQDIAAAKTLAQKTNLDLLADALQTAQVKLELLAAQEKTAEETDDGSAKSTAVLTQSKKDLADQLGKVASAEVAYTKALEGAADADIAAGNSLKNLNTFGIEFMSWSGMAAASAKEFGIEVLGASAQSSMLSKELDQTKAHLADVTAGFLAGTATTQQYQSAVKAAQNAQIALDEENAIGAAGLQGLTDTTSLYEAAVVSAKAKVDDLTTAVQNGTAKQQDLLAAERALTSAQDALNKSVQTGTADFADLLVPMGTTLDQMRAMQAAGSTAAAGLDSVAAAAKTAAQQVAAVDSSLHSVIADANDIMELGSSASKGTGSFGAPAGFAWQAEGIYGQSASLVPTTLAAAQAVMAAWYNGTLVPPYDGNTLLAAEAFISNAALVAEQNAAAATSTGAAVMSPTQPTGITFGGGTTASGGTASGGTLGTTTVDTSAYGGSYPGIVAHQAAGEVWAVQIVAAGATSSVSAAASSAAPSADLGTIATANSAAAASVEGAAGAVGGAVTQLVLLGEAIIQVANAVATSHTGELGYGMSTSPLPTGSTTTQRGTATSTTGQPGYANSFNGTVQGNVGTGGNSYLPTAAEYQAQQAAAQAAAAALQGSGAAYDPHSVITVAPPEYASPATPVPPPYTPPVGGASQGASTAVFHIDFSRADFRGATDPNAIQSAVVRAVTTAMPRVLRDNGARF